MYVTSVLALMLVCPLISILAQIVLADHSAIGDAPNLIVVAKWYVFWAVGVRLLSAGLRQIFQPRYTVEKIMGLKSGDSLFFVRELGFANVSMGSVGVASLLAPPWLTPAAMLGALYYGLAGFSHSFHGNRNKLQNLAMASDLFAALVLVICCFARW